MERKITELLPKEITHEQIFDLWFKVKCEQYKKDIFDAWTKVTMYSKDGYSFDGRAWMNKEELLKLEHSLYPKEDI